MQIVILLKFLEHFIVYIVNRFFQQNNLGTFLHFLIAKFDQVIVQ